MKRWQKFALLAATPSVSILHSRWIAHLLGTTWDHDARSLALFMAILVTLTVAIIVGVTEGMVK